MGEGNLEIYCIEHSRIESLEEPVNFLVFAHGPLLAYASTAHGIALHLRVRFASRISILLLFVLIIIFNKFNILILIISLTFIIFIRSYIVTALITY